VGGCPYYIYIYIGTVCGGGRGLKRRRREITDLENVGGYGYICGVGGGDSEGRFKTNATTQSKLS